MAAVAAQLEQAQRLETPLGQAALALARRMGDRFGTGQSLAALSKELRAVLAEALEGVAGAADGLDELRERRDAKRDRASAG